MVIVDVFEAQRTRRSIRKFRPKPIPDEKLEIILEAGRLAPSAGNRQPWRFVVVKDPERKRTLAKARARTNYCYNGVIIKGYARRA